MSAMFEIVESRPATKRARSGRVSMYPAMVEALAANPGVEQRLLVDSVSKANSRRKNLLKVPTTGGKVDATTRTIDGQHFVYARFDRKGRAAITVAGKPLGGEAEVEAPASE